MLTLLLLVVAAHGGFLGDRTVHQITVGGHVGWTFGAGSGGFSPGFEVAWLWQRATGFSAHLAPQLGLVAQTSAFCLHSPRAAVAGRAGVARPFVGDESFFEHYGASFDAGIAIDLGSGQVGPHLAGALDGYMTRAGVQLGPVLSDQQPTVLIGIDWPLRSVTRTVE